MVKITLGNASRGANRTPISVGGKLKIDRYTYQALSSLVQNRVLADAYDNDELPQMYRRTLDELNNLYLKRTYPELYGSLVIAEGVEELDAYLGSLGITEEYPYSKDSVNIKPWLGEGISNQTRVLVDESDNTYLVDGTDNTVLVRYL